MDELFTADQSFQGINYSQKRLAKSDYEHCIFEGCDFADGYLDKLNSMEYRFIDCHMSNTNLMHTTFKEVVFTGCKMVGLKFIEYQDKQSRIKKANSAYEMPKSPQFQVSE